MPVEVVEVEAMAVLGVETWALGAVGEYSAPAGAAYWA